MPFAGLPARSPSYATSTGLSSARAGSSSGRSPSLWSITHHEILSEQTTYCERYNKLARVVDFVFCRSGTDGVNPPEAADTPGIAPPSFRLVQAAPPTFSHRGFFH